MSATVAALFIAATDGAQGKSKKTPPLAEFSQLAAPGLRTLAVPLPDAEIRTAAEERILVKFRNAPHVAALRVEMGRRNDALRVVRARNDVEFAEPDSIQQRQFSPNDPLVTNQWHHSVIGSFEAWNFANSEPSVRIAIVDTPFQMDHPDLAAHTDPGWDIVEGAPITASSGIDHSTLGAGMAAAIFGNRIGVAGASNCRVLPINIGGAISEMYDAVIWAADHGVRVVNISWTGADSDTLNAAAQYLKTKARGIMAMPGVNGAGFLNYTNQPDIYCISMTDAADNAHSRFGNHIDFAAPGWEIFTTTTNSGYAFASGTSYSTPLFCGVVASLFSINPTLGPDEVIQILKTTSVDLGGPGWDQFFGYGRINFAAAAAAANASRPVISSVHLLEGKAVVAVENAGALQYSLWKASAIEPSKWLRVENAAQTFTNGILTFADPAIELSVNFYRVEGRLP